MCILIAGYSDEMRHDTVGLSNQSMTLEHDCDDVQQQNIELKKKLDKTRKMFHKTLIQLQLSNQRKEKIENDIRNEIYKTHNVLRTVKYNIANVK